jgi:hypothetical protein
MYWGGWLRIVLGEARSNGFPQWYFLFVELELELELELAFDWEWKYLVGRNWDR